jgi:Cu(I)/Ag(I) efflux system membrane fusion protein
MKRPSFAYKLPALLVMLALLTLAACQRHDGAGNDPNVDYYTCTMHPSVHSHDPHAKCPICSMDLVPVMKKGAGPAPGGSGPVKTVEGTAVSQNSEFSVPVERQQQIGVTYAEVKKNPLRRTIRSVGSVSSDKTRRWEFVARVEGYVQKLEVTSPGEAVQKDQPLLTIYSPDLLTTQREFLNTLELRDRATSAESKASTQRLLDASRFRMEQWNVTPGQIAELEKSHKVSEFLTLRSPFQGVVENVPVEQGRRVMPGDPLVAVADLSVVWVWAEFYENEVPLLKPGLKVTLTANAYPGESFEGSIGLVNPFLSAAQRTAKARVDISNPGFKLRPGMFMNLSMDIDAGGALSIPVSAVMPTGDRSLVFVDKGAGRLEPRQVQLGEKYGDLYEVKDGLKEGERVVASGNFLIDAESKVQGAVKSFEEPTPEEPAKAAATPPASPLPKEARALYEPVMASYLAVEKLLNLDKLDGVPAKVEELRNQVQAIAKSGVQPPDRVEMYRKDIAAVAGELSQFKTDNLGDARISFGKVSAALIAVLTEFPPPLEGAVYVMNCPMWEKSPANWLQASDAIANPFMGAKMSGCGDVVKTLQPAK